MDLTTNSLLLTWTVFTPAIGLAAILLLLALRPLARWPQVFLDQAARGIGVVTTVVATALGIALWAGFDGSTAALQFIHRTVWMRSWNIEYFVAVDGLSLSMVVLTVVVFLAGAVASLPWWGALDDHHPHFSKRHVPGYWVLFLLLETGVLGTFAAQDFFLFYVFWEVMLLPMYFLIGIWGAPPRRDPDGRVRGGPYAAIKFFLYTLAGSVLMLLAMIAIYYASGPGTLADGTATQHTFNLPLLARQAREGTFLRAAPILGLDFARVVFVGLFIGFAIKVPMFPFHTWLPDAHVDAPTPISVILAGILLKTGVYGLFRFNLQLFPGALDWASYAVGVLGVVNIVYGAFVCMAQKDLKKLIAYSSVSHMGFCLLGLAAGTPQAVNGAIFQMVGHGIVSPMLFLVAGVIYDRAHTRQIEAFGGLAHRMPEYAAVTGLAFMASLGLPGLAGFVGEVLVFLGSFAATDPLFRVLVSIGALSVIITAAYYLWTMQRMFLGPFNEAWAHLMDMNWRERITLYPLAVVTVVLGVWPVPVFRMLEGTVGTLIGGLGH
ncbi:MAG TPA: NADH-quinone oxidoreductase subunit M [Myxococcota bacterium]|nr:NADH-quinone oxidoreductase subunit M [Myxococcota bacterium]HQK50900.1 NADH-quinone oxidoreductase subunit M [Myxococcota bacterium]